MNIHVNELYYWHEQHISQKSSTWWTFRQYILTETKNRLRNKTFPKHFAKIGSKKLPEHPYVLGLTAASNFKICMPVDIWLDDCHVGILSRVERQFRESWIQFRESWIQFCRHSGRQKFKINYYRLIYTARAVVLHSSIHHCWRLS